jgi:squalene-hopene/tetraprenyl-beta-curcumene cyclase
VTLGYSLESPPVAKGLEAIERFGIEEADTFRLQACVSPIWDTVLSVTALADAGVSRMHPAVRKSVMWLLGKQVRREGDWSVKNRRSEPGGWATERFEKEYLVTLQEKIFLL